MRETGHAITERQEAEGWGARVIDQLGDEIQRAFPGVGGFSRPNIYRMRAFYLAYPAAESASAIVSQAVRQFAEPLPPEVPDLPWGHIVTLQRLKDPSLRQWYARAAAEGGWSRAVLLAQIDTRLHEREGAAITNFARTLPPPRSDLAQQSLKDPYVFDFLTLGRDAQERDARSGPRRARRAARSRARDHRPLREGPRSDHHRRPEIIKADKAFQNAAANSDARNAAGRRASAAQPFTSPAAKGVATRDRGWGLHV
jgi:hypothetical protein